MIARQVYLCLKCRLENYIKIQAIFFLLLLIQLHTTYKMYVLYWGIILNESIQLDYLCISDPAK